MVVGDIVSGIWGGVTGYVSFQPAVGVEIIITGCAGGTGTYVGHTDGALTSHAINTNTNGVDTINMKLGITNSIYLRLLGTTTGASFSGIQIK